MSVLEPQHNKTAAAVLAIVTVPVRAGTRANASRTLGRQAAEQDVIFRFAIFNLTVYSKRMTNENPRIKVKSTENYY